jgi:hypothetical protein
VPKRAIIPSRQQVEEAILLLLREIALPIRILIRVPFSYSLFLLTTISLFVLLGHEVYKLLSDFLYTMSLKYGLRPLTYERLVVTAALLSGILPVPFMLGSFVLPVRLFLIYQRLPLKDLITESPAAYRLALQSSIVAIRTVFMLLLPLFALLFLVSFFLLKGISPVFCWILFLIGFIFISPLLSRAVPALCIPIISVLTRFEPLYAAKQAWNMLHSERGHIALVFLMTCLLCGISLIILPPVYYLGETQVGLLPLCMSLFFFWIGLSTLSGICAQAIITYERNQVHIPSRAHPAP